MSDKRKFDDFSVGDRVVFDKVFSLDDFTAFSRLSGDANPLHRDAKYAALSGFAAPIVPMHLVLAPLSMLAGMNFPGEPSLYLSHDARALRPVLYGESLRYSTRVVAVNRMLRVLTLRVLVLRGREVVLEAAMRTHARSAEWQAPPSLPLIGGSVKGRALVTGASGAIGAAIAIALAKQGWPLLLHDRGPGDRRKALQAALGGIDAHIEFIAADLATAAGRAAVAKAAGDDAALLVHSASPRIDAQAEDLAVVNYAALKEVADAMLPAMLSRQEGALLFIGSAATETAIPGWENYAAAKAMATSHVSALDKLYSPFGVRGLVLSPGFVVSQFSAAHRPADQPALLPQEVAAHALDFLAEPNAADNMRMIHPGRVVTGRYGFSTVARTLSDAVVHGPAVAAPQVATAATGSGTPPSMLRRLIRTVLKLAPDADLAGGGLGSTPGWDSLKHIELILEIESALAIRFDTSEIDQTSNYDALLALCLRKMSAAA